jgi:catechol 2,3-dioxygenase-like lactoylglutathione lyase family enzyme
MSIVFYLMSIVFYQMSNISTLSPLKSQAVKIEKSKGKFKAAVTIILSITIGFMIHAFTYKTEKMENNELKLGVFSTSLAVKDLLVSKAFYEKLGFKKMGGDEKQNYLIMKNGNTIIGLFQGMFEKNMLTFNPGWDENAQEVNPFDDVRKIQQVLEENKISIDSKVEPNSKGPGSLVFKDPDGNIILIDQHR